jgi:ribose 5-phosphate isomerase A
MADWKNPLASTPGWIGEISNREAKAAVARQLAQRLQPGDVVGVGSGSTAFLALEACAARATNEGFTFTAIPTSLETAQSCVAFGVPVSSLAAVRPDWCFDGADEVDPQKRLIKGRGGACFREKLVWRACVGPQMLLVDQSKFVDALGSKFSVPVEVVPEAIMLVDERLREVPGVTEVLVRPAGLGKDGPVLTEYGNLLLEVGFDVIAAGMEVTLEAIPGVVACGIFEGDDPEIVSA